MTPKQKLEMEFGEAIGWTEISLRRQNHAVFRAEMLRFLRKMQAKAHTEFVRREMARRVAERILSRACMPPQPEATLTLEFKRMNRLGYSNIDRRVHIAAMLGRWVQLGKEDSPIVRPFIADTARRLRCVKRGRFKRECMKDIEQAMVRTGMKPG
ncbi:hypothetical protein [Pyxidicoccus xibeiensis]|uniref:hypothetical protein n=1 Tax=Pyxidicoccus xibeiensis TaxID=2906759 RepID=UPI0020A7F82E|nr:hypothetical protein [Pyxidicoccus xibeiensis]MCP3144013.1 hypothetical protein [Pyxidicoccus xibeiensis]